MPHRSSRRFPLLPKHTLNLAGNMQLEFYHRMMWAGILFPREVWQAVCGPCGLWGLEGCLCEAAILGCRLKLGLAFRVGYKGDYVMLFVPID